MVVDGQDLQQGRSRALVFDSGQQKQQQQMHKHNGAGCGWSEAAAAAGEESRGAVQRREAADSSTGTGPNQRCGISAHRLDAQLGVPVHRLCVRPVAQVEQRGQLGGVAAEGKGGKAAGVEQAVQVRSLPPQSLPTVACAAPSGRALAASRQSRYQLRSPPAGGRPRLDRGGHLQGSGA